MSTLWSWSGAEVEGVERRQMAQRGGGWGQRWPGVGGEGEGRSYKVIP